MSSRIEQARALLLGAEDEIRRAVTEQLNNAVRRLRSSEERDVWFATLLEATAPFAARTAVFSVTGGTLRMEAAESLEIAIAEAPAFGSAVESKEVVVAAATPGELSALAHDVLKPQEGGRVYLLPLVLREQVRAILYADPGEAAFDVNAIELLCSVAETSAAAAEAVRAESKPAELIRIAGIQPAASPAPHARPAWADLGREEQSIHLRAQRLARNRVASMLLERPEQVRHGRASHNLYGTLRSEIDAARDEFRNQFQACPSMVDYLHLELVRTLAKDDSRSLGPDYPGPLP